MAYSKEVNDHFNNPRNVGSFENADIDSSIGTGIVGAPACGDVMQLQIKVKNGVIEDAKFKTFGCGSAIASSSYATEILIGKSVDEIQSGRINSIKSKNIVEHLLLPPVKIHCSILAEDAVKAAIEDYNNKNVRN